MIYSGDYYYCVTNGVILANHPLPNDTRRFLMGLLNGDIYCDYDVVNNEISWDETGGH